MTSTGKLPPKGSRTRKLIDYLDQHTGRTIEQIVGDNPSRFGFRLSEMVKQLEAMRLSWLVHNFNGIYHLTEYALVKIGSEQVKQKVNKGPVAEPRINNVFAESTGAIAAHLSGMRRALNARAA